MVRRLAAILIADVVGYSRLIEVDETGTLAELKSRRKSVLEPIVRTHGGRIVKFMGDGALVEFASAVSAVTAAFDLQRAMAEANANLADERRIHLRIGINLGDVVGEGSDVFGDGVNIAARLEALAEPGGICISAKVHDEVRGKIEPVFEDAGEQQLRNIATPVRAYRSSRNVAFRPSGAAHAGSDKPSIAVLPFDNMSGEPNQQYLSDGITEDIITELSRFKSLSVTSRHASFYHAGKGASLAQVARDLSVHYVLEGSLRKSGDRLRITAQLIDTKSGSHVWAERYDRDSRDIYAVQDEVVAAIVATLEGRVVTAAAALSRKKPTASWTAYDYLLQGRELANAHKEREAVPLFSQAVAVDPNFAHAHAWLAIGYLATYWYDTDPATLARAAQAAQRALELDSDDSTVHHANAMVMLWLRHYERSGMHFERAMALNPVDAQIRADRVNWLRYTGHPEEALAAIDDALQRSPYPPTWFWKVRGETLLQMKRYGEAVAAFAKMPESDHRSYATQAAAYAFLGDMGMAAEAIAKARQIRPSISIRKILAVSPMAEPYASDLAEGLRKAGLPE